MSGNIGECSFANIITDIWYWVIHSKPIPSLFTWRIKGVGLQVKPLQLHGTDWRVPIWKAAASFLTAEVSTPARSFFHPWLSPTYTKVRWSGRMYVRPTTSYTSEMSAAFQYEEKEVQLVPKKKQLWIETYSLACFLAISKNLQVTD